MAKSKGAKSSKPKTQRVRSFLNSGKVRLGEAALALLTGYFGGRIMASTPIPAITAAKMKTQPNNSILNQAYAAMPAYANDPAGWVSDETARVVGFLAIAKAGYDVVKKGRLESTDVNVGIPFAIGAILSPMTTESDATGASGAW